MSKKQQQKQDQLDELQQILKDERDVIEVTYNCLTVGPRWSVEKPNTQVLRRGNVATRELTQKDLNSIIETRLIFDLVGTETEKNKINLCLEIVLQKQYPKHAATCNVLKYTGLLERDVEQLLSELKSIAVKHERLKEVVLWALLDHCTNYLHRMNSELPEDTLLDEYYKNQQQHQQQQQQHHHHQQQQQQHQNLTPPSLHPPTLSTESTISSLDGSRGLHPLPSKSLLIHINGSNSPLSSTFHLNSSFNDHFLDEPTFFHPNDSFSDSNSHPAHVQRNSNTNVAGFRLDSADDDTDHSGYVMYNINSEQIESDSDTSIQDGFSLFTPILPASVPVIDNGFENTFESFLSGFDEAGGNFRTSGAKRDKKGKSDSKVAKAEERSKVDPKVDKTDKDTKGLKKIDTKSAKHDKKDDKKDSKHGKDGKRDKKYHAATPSALLTQSSFTPTDSPAITPQASANAGDKSKNKAGSLSTTITPASTPQAPLSQSQTTSFLLSTTKPQQPQSQSPSLGVLSSLPKNSQAPTSLNLLSTNSPLQPHRVPPSSQNNVSNDLDIEPLGDFQLTPSKLSTSHPVNNPNNNITTTTTTTTTTKPTTTNNTIFSNLQASSPFTGAANSPLLPNQPSSRQPHPPLQSQHQYQQSQHLTQNSFSPLQSHSLSTNTLQTSSQSPLVQPTNSTRQSSSNSNALSHISLSTAPLAHSSSHNNPTSHTDHRHFGPHSNSHNPSSRVHQQPLFAHSQSHSNNNSFIDSRNSNINTLTHNNNSSFPPDARFSHTKPPQFHPSDTSSMSEDDNYPSGDENLQPTHKSDKKSQSDFKINASHLPDPPTDDSHDVTPLVPLFLNTDNPFPPRLSQSTTTSTSTNFLAECRTPEFYPKLAPSHISDRQLRSSRPILEATSTPTFLPHSPSNFSSLPMSPALSASIPLHPVPPPLPQLEQPMIPVSDANQSRYLLDFSHERHLGKGGQGRVFLARHKMSELEYAVKRIRLNPKDEQQQKLILTEMKTLATLQHPYVCRYFHSWAESSQGVQVIQEYDPITGDTMIRGLTSGSDNPDILDDIDDAPKSKHNKKHKNKRLGNANSTEKTQHSLINCLDDDVDSLYDDSSFDSDEDFYSGEDSDISVHVDYDPDIDSGPPPPGYVKKTAQCDANLLASAPQVESGPTDDFLIDWTIDNNANAAGKRGKKNNPKKGPSRELNISNVRPGGKNSKRNSVLDESGGRHAHLAKFKGKDDNLSLSDLQKRQRDQKRRETDKMIRDRRQNQFQKGQMGMVDEPYFTFSFTHTKTKFAQDDSGDSGDGADDDDDDDDEEEERGGEEEEDEDDSDDNDDPFSRIFNKQTKVLDKAAALKTTSEEDEDEDDYEDEDEDYSDDSDDPLSRMLQRQRQVEAEKKKAENVQKSSTPSQSDKLSSFGFIFASSPQTDHKEEEEEVDDDDDYDDEDDDWDDEDWDEDKDLSDWPNDQGDRRSTGKSSPLTSESSDIEMFPFQTNHGPENNKYSSTRHADSVAEPQPPQPPQLHQYLYISMEYCNQNTLHTTLADESNGLDLLKAWRIVRQLLDALKYIHQQGVVHRDIKPQNIFVSSDGVKLGDFGLALLEDQLDPSSQHQPPLDPMSPDIPHDASNLLSRRSMESKTASQPNSASGDGGTQLYASPEQLGQIVNPVTHKKVKAGPKSDIFSLGFVLVELFFDFHSLMDRNVTFAQLRSTGKLPHDVLINFERKYKPVPPSNLSTAAQQSTDNSTSRDVTQLTLYGDISAGTASGAANTGNEMIASNPSGTASSSTTTTATATSPEMEEYLQKKASYERDYKNIPKLVEWMCSAKPDQRPSARELLSSNLIPVLHNDDLLELITSCIDPISPYYHQIINKLFAQNGYHAHSRSNTHNKTNPELIYQQKFNFTFAPLKLDHKSYSNPLYIREFVTNCLRKVLKLHHFVHIPSPQLLPYAEVKDLLVHSLPLMRQEDGALLQLPHHLSLSFIHFLSSHNDLLSLSYTALATSKQQTQPGILSPSAELRRYDTGIYSQVNSKHRSTLTNRQATVCDITWLLHSQKHIQELRQLAIYEKQLRDYENGGVGDDDDDDADDQSLTQSGLSDTTDKAPTYTIEQLSKKHLWPTTTYNHIITKLSGELDLIYMEEMRRTSFVFAESLFLSASSLAQLYVPAFTVSYTHRRLLSFIVAVIARAVPEALTNSNSDIATIDADDVSPTNQSHQLKLLGSTNANNNNNPSGSKNNSTQNPSTPRDSIEIIQNSIQDILSILVHQIFKSQHYLETKVPNYFNMQYVENNTSLPDTIPNPEYYNSIISQSKTTSMLSQNNSSSRKPSSRAQPTSSSRSGLSNSNLVLPPATLSPQGRGITDQTGLFQYFKNCSRSVDFVIPFHNLTIDQQQQFVILLSNFSEQALNEQSRDLAEKIHPAYVYILYLCVTIRIPVVHVPSHSDITSLQFTKLCLYLHSILDLLTITPQLIQHFEPDMHVSNAYLAIPSVPNPAVSLQQPPAAQEPLPLNQILAPYVIVNSVPINTDLKKRATNLTETSAHLYFKHIPSTFLNLSCGQTQILLEHILFTSLRELNFIQDYSQRFQLLRHSNNFHTTHSDGNNFKSFEEYASHQEQLIKLAESRTFPTPIIHFQFSLSASLMHSYEDMKDTPLFVFHSLIESKKAIIPFHSTPSSSRTPHFHTTPTPSDNEKTLFLQPRLTLTNHTELQHSPTPTTIFAHAYKSNELLARYNPKTFLSGVHISFDHETIVSWLNKLFINVPTHVLTNLQSQAMDQPLLFSSPQNMQIMMQYQLDQSNTLNRLRTNLSVVNNIYQNIGSYDKINQLTETTSSKVPQLTSNLQHVLPPICPEPTSVIEPSAHTSSASMLVAKTLSQEFVPPVLARKIPTAFSQQSSKEISRLQRSSEYIQQHFKYRTYKLVQQLTAQQANFRASAIDFAADQHRALTQLLQTQCTSVIIYGDPQDSFRRQRLQISELLWAHNFSVEHVYTNSGQAHVQIAQQRGARFRVYLNSAGMQQNLLYVSEYNPVKRQFGPQHNVPPDSLSSYLIGLIVQAANQFNIKIRNKVSNFYSQSQSNFKTHLKSSSAFYAADVISHACDTTIIEQPLIPPSQKDQINAQSSITGPTGVNPAAQVSNPKIDQQNSAQSATAGGHTKVGKKHAELASDKHPQPTSNNPAYPAISAATSNSITFVQLQSQRNSSKLSAAQIAQHLGPGIMMIAHEVLVVSLDLKQLQQVAIVVRENPGGSLAVLQNIFYASIGVKQTKQETKLNHQQQLQLAAIETYVRSAKTAPTDKSKFIIFYSIQTQTMEIIHR